MFGGLPSNSTPWYTGPEVSQILQCLSCPVSATGIQLACRSGKVSMLFSYSAIPCKGSCSLPWLHKWRADASRGWATRRRHLSCLALNPVRALGRWGRPAAICTSCDTSVRTRPLQSYSSQVPREAVTIPACCRTLPHRHPSRNRRRPTKTHPQRFSCWWWSLRSRYRTASWSLEWPEHRC